MMNRAALLVLLAIPTAFGCSSDPTPAPAGTDAGATDASKPVDSGAVVDSAIALVNACATFEDHTGTADTRTLTWDFSIGSSPSRCTKISVGQSVTWAGDFTAHPLLTQGGTQPSPIATVDKATGKVTFTTAGTYGFVCGIHSSMNGAILVTQ